MDATAPTTMSEEDYQRLIVVAYDLGRTEPNLDGPEMFKRLGLLPADHDGVFLTPVIEKVGTGRRAFAIRRAYLNITI